MAAYGPFTDVGLDFAASDTGLHLIYGPNEAGKSTALRAVHALLFGVEVRTRDNFLHAKPDSLRIGGALENAAGQRIRIVRRKGRKDTLLNPDHPESAPHADEALVPFLAGIDKHGFARIFAIGHEELREGGGELQELRGLVGESLFASASGGPRLTRLMASLSEQANALFVPRGKCKIRESVKDYKLLTDQRKAAEMRIPTWEKLTSARDAARKSHELSAERLKQLRTEAHRLDRMQQAVTNLQERDRLLINKQSLGASVLPQEYCSEDRTQCQSQASMLDSHHPGVNRPTRRPRRCIGTTERPHRGCGYPGTRRRNRGFAGRTRRDRKSRVATDAKGRDRDRLLNYIASLLQEVQSSGAATSTVLATSDPDAMISAAEQLRLPTNHIVAIRSLANDEQLLRKDSRDKHREWERLTSRLAEYEHDLETLGPSLRVTELEATLTIVAKRPVSMIAFRPWKRKSPRASRPPMCGCTSWAYGREAWTRCCWRQCHSARPSIGLTSNGRVCRIVATPLWWRRRRRKKIWRPPCARSRRCNGRRPHLRRRNWGKAWRKGSSLGRDTSGMVVPPNEPRPAPDPPRLAERLTKAIRESDHLADRLRREADRVALLARRQAEVAELQSNLRRLSLLQEQFVIESSELQQAWLAVWQPVGVDQPRTPRKWRRGWNILENLNVM